MGRDRGLSRRGLEAGTAAALLLSALLFGVVLRSSELPDLGGAGGAKPNFYESLPHIALPSVPEADDEERAPRDRPVDPVISAAATAPDAVPIVESPSAEGSGAGAVTYEGRLEASATTMPSTFVLMEPLSGLPLRAASAHRFRASSSWLSGSLLWIDQAAPLLDEEVSLEPALGPDELFGGAEANADSAAAPQSEDTQTAEPDSTQEAGEEDELADEDESSENPKDISEDPEAPPQGS